MADRMSYWRETAVLARSYLVAVAAFVPAGIIYAIVGALSAPVFVGLVAGSFVLAEIATRIW